MTEFQPRGPQNSLLFKVVGFFTRRQLWYLIRNSHHARWLVIAFVFFAGGTALGIITVLAYLTSLPLLFPQLGPSAFILFYTPMAEAASPRNIVFSHTLAVICGLLSLWIIALIYPDSNLHDPSILNGQRVLAIALSMGVSCMLMVVLNCVHPPAAASAVIAALGYLENPVQVIGIEVAVILLLVEAFFFNRVIGGLPYPVWGYDPKVARNFGEMAGIPANEITFWRQTAMKTFQRR